MSQERCDFQGEDQHGWINQCVLPKGHEGWHRGPPDEDRACVHPEFEAHVEVNRLYSEPHGDPEVFPDAFAADVRVECAVCHERFRFIGCQAGLMPDRPMVNASEDELRVPIRPASSDPDYGLGIPGFAVGFRRPGE